MTRRGHRRILSRQRSQRRQFAAWERSDDDRGTADQRDDVAAAEAEAA